MKYNSTVSLRPFCYILPSFRSMTICMLCVFVPHIVMLALTASYNSIILLVCSVIASLAAELLDKLVIRKKNPDVLTAILQGVMIGLLLPATYPSVAVFFIVLCTLLIAKYAFGGVSGSWINPMAITVLVAYCICPSFFPVFSMPVEHLQVQNTSLLLIQDGVLPVHSFDSVITNFLNDYVFSLLGTTIPDGYVSLLWDSGSIIPAFRFNLLTLIASLVMFSMSMISCSVPLCFILVYTLLVKLFCPVFVGGNFANGDIILSLLTSGTLFTAFFVLSWYGTVPLTTGGRIIFGCFAGIAAFFITGYGLSSVGSMFTVFSANIVSVLIQFYENKRTTKILCSKKNEPQVQMVQE